MGLEAIVEVTTKNELDAALAAGAKMVSAYSGDDVKAASELRASIPKEVIALGALNGRGYGGPKALFDVGCFCCECVHCHAAV
jgi:hypothetical protein